MKIEEIKKWAKKSHIDFIYPKFLEKTPISVRICLGIYVLIEKWESFGQQNPLMEWSSGSGHGSERNWFKLALENVACDPGGFSFFSMSQDGQKTR